MSVWRAAAWLPLLLSLSACGAGTDVIVRTGAGNELAAADIDREPLALLPGNAIGIASLDAKQLMASPFGTKLTALLSARLPLPPAAGFEPTRDLSHLYLGLYSMQGADMVGVVSGSFDKVKIEAAANGVDKTPLGTPVSKRSYAGHTLYTSANVGFCVLTEHTLLFGDHTGIRRALDRIQERRVRKQTAAWMDQLLVEQTAPFSLGLDLRAQPVPDAARNNLRFLQGLETLAVVGNFQDPGLNLAGTLVYGDEAAAKLGAENVRNLSQMLNTYAPLLALMGIPQPVRKLQAEAKDKETSFVVGVDGAAVAVLLDKARDFLANTR